MADNMTIPIATDIAMHKFFIASAKSCRIRLVEPEKSGQAAALLRARLAVPARALAHFRTAVMNHFIAQ
ncbi:hypothetical protein [Mesorhizobium abyssinicae]|uniref:hypothetical protein n=1 Tax=Mesorhizobium abyssinicae TaxID=1209958 RepID=UPI003392F1C4